MLAWAAVPAAAQSEGICGRTKLVRNGLIEWINYFVPDSVTDCAQVTAAHLRSVGSLTLYRLHLDPEERDDPIDLQAGDFAGLTGLQNLYANNVRIRGVPAGLFSEAPNLTRIGLSDNDIEHLPADFITGLTKLQSLYLTGNGLTSLPAGFFSGRTRPLVALGLSDVALEVTVVPLGSGRFAAYMPTAAPFDVEVTYVFADASETGQLTIPAGARISNQGAYGNARFIDIGTLPTPPRLHSGYRLVKAADLPVDTHGSDSTDGRVALNLAPSSVSEDGIARVWAQRSSPGLDEARLLVYALAKPDRRLGQPRTTPLDFTVGENRTLTIPAGASRSTNTVTITPANDDRYTWKREVNVAARPVAGTLQIPEFVTLTIEEDDPAPVISLELSPSSIAENGGSAEVTAALDRLLPGRLRLRVSVEPTAPARPYHYEVAAPTPDHELTIPAGRTSSAETITITAADDLAYVGNRELQVTASMVGYDGYDPPEGPVAPRTLTITEDEAMPGEGSGICARTEGVRTVLLRAISGVRDCANVTAAHLSAIETLAISGYYSGFGFDDAVVLNALQRGDFEGLSNLRALVIADTLIDRLPEGIFDGLADLERLVINFNTDLRHVPVGAFTGLPNLRYLSIAWGQHDYVPGSGLLRLPGGVFAELPTLTELILAGNRLNGRLDPEVFAGLENLERLDLSHNGLLSSTLPAGLFAGLSSLRGLGLDFNRIGSVPTGFFSDLTSLVAIGLVNGWQDLPDGLFEGLPALRYVKFSDGTNSKNTLRSFPDRIFHGLTGPLVHLYYGAHHTPSLEVSLQVLGPGRLRAVAPAGAPFNIVLPVSATNGTISGGATTLTIPAGAVASRELEVIRNPGTTAAVTVNIGALPPLPRPAGDRYITQFGLDFGSPGHFGYRLAKGGGLPLTVIADVDAPQVMLEVAQDTIPEDGGSTTVTARLPAVADPAVAEIRLTVSAAPVAPAVITDFMLSDPVLTIAAGARQGTGTATINAVNNDRYAGNRTLRVFAAVTGGAAAVPSVQTITITEDEPAPEVTLDLSAASIDEDGGAAVVSAALSSPPGVPVVVTVTATPDAPAVPGDFVQKGSALTIAAGTVSSTGAVTIAAVHNPADQPNKTLQVSATVDGLPGLAAPATRTLTIVDIDGAPTTRLLLDPVSITEGGGRSTVTARLSHAASELSILNVRTEPVAPAVAGDFVQSGTTLTIAAGQTESSGSVTITARDDTQYRPWNKPVEVTASTISGDASNPVPVRLTIEENDPPDANALLLVLSPQNISENGGHSVVSARLSAPLNEQTVIAVSATPVAPAVAADFMLSGSALTILEGQTDSTGTVTITAVDNSEFGWDKTIEVAAAGTAQSLIIAEDEPRPVVSIELSNASIAESGGATEIKAKLDRPVSEHIYLRLTVEPVSPALLADFTVSGNLLQKIPQGETETEIGQIGSLDFAPVTVTAVNDIMYTGDKRLRVIGRLDPVGSLPWLLDPAPRTLTIEEDESQTPTGGICDRTQEVRNAILAALSVTDCAEVTPDQLAHVGVLEVYGERANMPLRPGDFAGLPNMWWLNIKAAWYDASLPYDQRIIHHSLTDLHPRLFTGELDAITKLSIDGFDAITIPEDLFADLSNLEYLELLNNRSASFLPPGLLAHTPKLRRFRYGGVLESVPADFFREHPSLQDISLAGNVLTTLPEGVFSGLRALSAVDLSDNHLTSLPPRVFAGLPHLNGVRITDTKGDNPMSRLPEAAFAGLTAALSSLELHAVSMDVTLRAAGQGRFRAAVPAGAPFDMVLPVNVTNGSIAGGATSVTIPAGALESAAVEVTRAPATTAAVTADIGTLPVLPANHAGYELVKAALPLTVIAAEGAPAVTLELSDSSIPEAGGTAGVTARLSSPAAAELQLAVSAAPVTPATHEDFMLGADRVLTIAAGGTESNNTVTVTARDNDRYAGDRTVEIAAAVTAGSAAVPAARTLTITEDEPVPPPIALVLSANTISEADGSALVTAAVQGASLGATVSIAVTVTPEAPADTDHFAQTGATLTIAAGAAHSTGTVRIDAVDDYLHAPDRRLRIGATLAGLAGIPPLQEQTLTIAEDEAVPAVTLVLSGSSVEEAGGAATVTATLDPPSSTTTTVTVRAEPVEPAVAGDIQQEGATLTFAPGHTVSSGTVRITAVDNGADTPNRQVKVRGVARNASGVNGPRGVVLEIRDDDSPPVVSLRLEPNPIDEHSGSAAVTAVLDRSTSEELTLTVTAEAVPPALETEFAHSGNSLIIAAGQTASTGSVTIAGVDDDSFLGDKQVRVTAAVAGQAGVAAPEPVTLTIEEDEVGPEVTLVLDPAEVSEEAATATVTATIEPPVSEPFTITVEAAPVAPAAAADFTLSANRELTIGAGDSASTGTVTITTVGNSLASPPKTVRVTGKVLGARGLTPAERLLTITDDEPVPKAALVLSPAAIREDGASAAVTASLDQRAGVDTVLRVTTEPVAPAVAGDFRQQGNTLTIAAGAIASTGGVTITALDNDVDASNRTVTVSAEIAAGYATAPDALPLAIEDNDGPPAVQLLLSPAPISENGGVSNVTARLDHPSSEPTTVTVTATAGDHATDQDFALSANRVLSIAAGARASTGEVTITAVDDSRLRPDRSVIIAGTASNARGVTDPAERTLAIEDDEPPPAVTLELSTRSIAETGTNEATVTVTLEPALDRATTYTVAAAPIAPAYGAVSLSDNPVLTVGAGATASTGTVTVTAVNNDTDSPATTVRVTAAVGGFPGLPAPAPVELTVTDDDAAPAVMLVRSAASIDEDGGTARISATLTHPSGAETTVRVAAAPVTPATRNDFRQDGTLLVVAAGATASTGTVTITAVDNDTDARAKTVTVSATASNAHGVAGNPAPVAIGIEDDDDSPTVRLVLSPASIDESGSDSSSTVTAVLDHPSSAETDVTVSTAPAGADWYRQQGSTLTIAAGARTSSGTVQISAVDNQQYEPGRTVVVTGRAANGQGVTDPDARALIIKEDEPAPVVTLQLSNNGEIAEDGGAATVTVTLDRSVHAETTFEVKVQPEERVELSANRMLTIAAGQRNSTGAVTITAVPDNVDAPNRKVRVTAAVGGLALPAPAARTLTIADDDDAPTVTLKLSPDLIGERRWESAVMATLEHPSSAPTTVRVTVEPVSPAVLRDYRQSGTTLTIPAGATESTGRVAIGAVDNDVDAPNKTLVVSATAHNPQGVAGDPQPARLAIVDDDAAPLVRLVLIPRRISEQDEWSRVAAWIGHPSSADTTVTVAATAVGPTDDPYYEVSSGTTLTIAAGARESTGTVTITAKDNAVYAADRFVTVSGDAANTQGISDPTPVTLTIAEDEPVPVVTLHLSSDQAADRNVSIGENGEQATVTVAVDRAFDRETTYTVNAVPVPPALPGDFSLAGSAVLTIDAGATESTGTLTITAVNNDTDAPDKEVQVTVVVGGFAGVRPPDAHMLTIRDDEDAPGVAMSLTTTALDERGGVAELTATLDHPSSEDTALWVEVQPDPPAVAADVRLTRNPLIIPAGERTSTGQFLVQAVDNAVDAPPKTMQIAAAAHNLQGIAGHPASLPLAVTDDETAPAVSLALSPAQIVENGGKSTVTATLDHPSSEDTTVSVGTEPASANWFTRSGTELTIAAGRRTSTGAVRIAAVNNDQDADDRTVTVTGTAANEQGVAGDPPALALTIQDDDNTPTVHLDLSSLVIPENGGVSTVSARLDHTSSTDTVVTVAAEPAGAAWYTQSGTGLTIAAGDSTSTGTVKITAVDNQEDEPNRTVTLSASVTAGSAVSERQPRRLTIADDEGTPTVWLELDGDASVPEGGSTTVTARMSATSSQGVSMRIAYRRDLRLSANPVLRIDAGQTASSGSVTITAPDDAVHGEDRQVVVRPTLFSAGGGILAPPAVTLTITENDAAPGVMLELSEATIPENGGETTVTARLDRRSSKDTTVTVGTAAVGDSSYFVQHGTTLTIAAGSLWSRGRVRITALDNDVDETVRDLRVTGTAANDLEVTQPPGLTLTIMDDDPRPALALALEADTVRESQVSTIAATLSGPSAEEVVLTVRSRLAETLSGNPRFTQTGTTLTIPAKATQSIGEVTITAVDDRTDEPDKTVLVSATATGGLGVASPAEQALTIVDDDEYPFLTLHIEEHEILEGSTMYAWITIGHPWHELLIISFPRAGGSGRPFTLEHEDLHCGSSLISNNRIVALRILPGEVTSCDRLLVRVFDDDIDEPNEVFDRQAIEVFNWTGNVPVFPRLVVVDDDDPPPVRLALSAPEISENGGVATVTATLDWPSDEPTTVDLALTSDSGAVPARLTRTRRLTIPARETQSTGAVPIVSLNNGVDAPDATVNVTGTAHNSLGIVAPPPVPLIVRDDEPTPVVRLTLSPAEIGDDGGVSTVTAALDGPSSEQVTVTVAATAVPPATPAGFTLSTNKALIIAAGQTVSTGAVTIAAHDDSGTGHKQVQVAGTVTGGNGLAAPAARTLTIRDDEVAPVLALALSDTTISENGGSTGVTAVLDYAAAAATTVTVTATAVPPATRADFTLSTNKVLSIAAGKTESIGVVTITARNDNLVTPHKQVLVGATVTGGAGVGKPADRMLVIEDDEAAPVLAVVLTPAAITEAGGASAVTATLNPAPGVQRTVTISAAPQAPAEAADYTLSGTTLTFASGAGASSGSLTISARDNDVYAPDKRISVTAAADGFRAAPAAGTLTIREDDPKLTVMLIPVRDRDRGAGRRHPGDSGTVEHRGSGGDDYGDGGAAGPGNDALLHPGGRHPDHRRQREGEHRQRAHRGGGQQGRRARPAGAGDGGGQRCRPVAARAADAHHRRRRSDAGGDAGAVARHHRRARRHGRGQGATRPAVERADHGYGQRRRRHRRRRRRLQPERAPRADHPRRNDVQHRRRDGDRG